jgi:hypothetical protein
MITNRNGKIQENEKSPITILKIVFHKGEMAL